jgi:hypothetical protein
MGGKVSSGKSEPVRNGEVKVRDKCEKRLKRAHLSSEKFENFKYFPEVNFHNAPEKPQNKILLLGANEQGKRTCFSGIRHAFGAPLTFETLNNLSQQIRRVIQNGLIDICGIIMKKELSNLLLGENQAFF